MSDEKIYGTDGVEFSTFDNSLYIMESIVTFSMLALLHQPELTLDPIIAELATWSSEISKRLKKLLLE